MLYQFTVFLQLLFLSYFHVTLFYQLQIWILKSGNFEPYFEVVNDFSWKSHEHKSCRTNQDLQLLFWSFVHRTKLQ
jgi:hypothetical protein